MALRTEILITLQQVKGLGNKSILEFAKSGDIDTMEDLVVRLQNIKKGRFAKLTEEELQYANRTARRIIEACENNGIGILSYFEPQYPSILRNCVDEKGKPDPPIVLYYRGNLSALKRPGVAVIGTREPTENGKKAAIFFSKILAKQGFNIVSGLAIGCDAAGHRGAMDADGITTAFLSTSLSWESIYPKENLPLAKEIVEKGGLLLSEYYIGQTCGKFSFVARDRLQAGLSYATLAIQTDIMGGTMHAINATLAARKPLYMVKYNYPEDLRNPKSQGNIKLLGEGVAKPITSENKDEVIKEIRAKMIQVGYGTQKDFSFNNNYTEKKMKKGVIFDLDLTLVDTTCLEDARHKRNWREAYNMIPHTSMYAGIRVALEQIRELGITIAIVSTAPRTYIERIISFYQIPAQHIVGYHDAKPIKPHPASMLKALELMNLEASEVISFGDRTIDIIASNAAGIESVACLWGTKEREKLLHSGYKHIIANPEEIVALLK